MGYFAQTSATPKEDLRQKVWHAHFYTYLGEGKFPMNTQNDYEGNLWHNWEKWIEKKNRGTCRAHALMPFQCEDCWMINLDCWLPKPQVDDACVMFIH